MSEFKPGTVAIATVRGVESVMVFRRESTLSTTHRDWAHSPAPESGLTYSCSNDDDVTDVRPLVVLDIYDPAFTVKALRDAMPADAENYDSQDRHLAAIADTIERQTKPARIPEPGLWGVVEDAKGRQFTRIDPVGTYPWQQLGLPATERAQYFEWSDIDSPTLVREGVQA